MTEAKMTEALVAAWVGAFEATVGKDCSERLQSTRTGHIPARQSVFSP